MEAVEKPDPNYPLYYVLNAAPIDVTRKLSRGKNPHQYRDFLMRQSDIELRNWINKSYPDIEVLFDLHDDTPHPEVWKYKKNDSLVKEGAIRLIDGLLAVEGKNLIELSYHYYKVDSRIQKALEKFKPKSRPYIPYGIESYQEIPDERILPVKNKISVEFMPIRIDERSGKLNKLSIKRGFNFFLKLLYQIRDYE